MRKYLQNTYKILFRENWPFSLESLENILNIEGSGVWGRGRERQTETETCEKEKARM